MLHFGCHFGCRGSQSSIDKFPFTLPLLVAIFVGACHAEIACYTNGRYSELLMDNYGDGGLTQCMSSSGCYEILSGHRDPQVGYQAGCGDQCPQGPPWNQAIECVTCSTPLCNNKVSNHIKANNLMCYMASGYEIGEKRVWCAKNVPSCNWMGAMDTDKKKMFYEASCATAFCPICNLCGSSLCNIPDDIKHLGTPASEASKVPIGSGAGSGKGDAGKGGASKGDEDEDDSGSALVPTASAVTATVLAVAAAKSVQQ